MAIIVKYVLTDEVGVKIKETFLDFLHVKDANANDLAGLLQNYLIRLKINMIYLHGQSCNGANVMCGEEGGLQKKLKNIIEEIEKVKQ